jgi:hypothetical protein
LDQGGDDQGGRTYFPNEEKSSETRYGIPEALASVQVSFNNVAPSVFGHRREDHITIVDLLEAAKYLSLNQQLVQATAISAWSAYSSSNGIGGTRNLVGSWMFGNVNLPPRARPTRATTAGRSGSGGGGWTRT